MAQMQRTGLPFNRIKLQELQAVLEADIERYGSRFVEELDGALPEDSKLPRDEDGSFNLRAKAEGLQPPGDVIPAVVSDEEKGGEFGARYLVENHAAQFKGVRYAIGEFGGFSFRKSSDSQP
jgi:hypothetical protein